MKKFIFLLLTLCILFSPAQTKATTGLSISPPVTEILLAPNKSVTTSVQITSTGVETSYSLSLHRLIPTGEDGHSTIDPKPIDPTSIPLVITLVGAEWGEPYYASATNPSTVSLRLEASSLDEPQDVYLALLARPLSPTELLESSTTTPAIAALLLTTITPLPAIPTNMSLDELKIPQVHDSYTPLMLMPSATNKSGVMLRVKGLVELKDPTGKIIQSSNLDPTLILGNTSRRLATINYQLSSKNLGPHTLTVNLTTEGGRELVNNSVVVWIFPIRYTIIVITLLILSTIIKLRSNRLTKRGPKV